MKIEIRNGRLRYVLDRACEPGTYVMSHWRGDERIHGYVVHGPPREFRFFRRTIEESFLPGKTFMSWLRIARFFEDHSADLIDRTLTIHRGSCSSDYELNSIREIRNAVDNEMRMPRCPVEEGVNILERLTGKKLFD